MFFTTCVDALEHLLVVLYYDTSSRLDGTRYVE